MLQIHAVVVVGIDAVTVVDILSTCRQVSITSTMFSYVNGADCARSSILDDGNTRTASTVYRVRSSHGSRVDCLSVFIEKGCEPGQCVRTRGLRWDRKQERRGGGGREGGG